MSISRCRHTFATVTSYAPWRRCNLCLEVIAPLSEVRHCSSCDCYVHNECYRGVLDQLERITSKYESASSFSERNESDVKSFSSVGSFEELGKKNVKTETTIPSPDADKGDKQLSTTPSVETVDDDISQALPGGVTLRDGKQDAVVEENNMADTLECQRSALLADFEENKESQNSSFKRNLDKLLLFPDEMKNVSSGTNAEGNARDSAPPVASVNTGEFNFSTILSQIFFSVRKAEDKPNAQSSTKHSPKKDISKTAEPTEDKSEVLFKSNSWILEKMQSILLEHDRRNNFQTDLGAKVVFGSFLKFIDLLLNKHPALLESSWFSIAKLRAINYEHNVMLNTTVQSLPDADILRKQVYFSRVEEARRKGRQSPDEGPATATAVAAQHSIGNLKHPSAISPASSVLTTQDHPILLALKDCVRYPTAAYGDNYRNPSKKPVAQILDHENDEAVTEVLALPASALRVSHWAKKAPEPSYALVVDSLSSRIVVAFRGTLTDADVVTDMCGFGLPFCGGVAHQGLVLSVNYLFDHRASTLPSATTEAAGANHSTREGPKDLTTSIAQTRTRLNDDPTAPFNLLTAEEEASLAPDYLLDTLQTVAETYRDCDILITGHSLGGGLAVLFGVRLQYDRTFPPQIHDRIRVVAYAAMPTLSLPAASGFGEPRDPNRPSEKRDGQEEGASSMIPIWNLVNGCDMIPRLQMNSIDRLCALLARSATTPNEECEMTDMKGKDADRKVEEGGREVSVIVPTGGDEAAVEGEDARRETGSTTNRDEDKSQKEEEEERYDSGGKDLMTELYHPGRVFMMTAPWDPNLNRLVEVPRGHIIMHELLLMKSMLELHTIDSYNASLRCVKSQTEVDNYLATMKR